MTHTHWGPSSSLLTSLKAACDTVEAPLPWPLPLPPHSCPWSSELPPIQAPERPVHRRPLTPCLPKRLGALGAASTQAQGSVSVAGVILPQNQFLLQLPAALDTPHPPGQRPPVPPGHPPPSMAPSLVRLPPLHQCEQTLRPLA